MSVAEFIAMMDAVRLRLIEQRQSEQKGSGPVHRELVNFKAFREFCGRHDTCFQDAATSTLASLDPDHWSADCVSMNRMANDMIANGRLNGGTTMSSGVAQLRDYGYQVDYLDWMHWHSELDLNALHALLIADAGILGIILQVGKAFELPGNEAGVYSHFVAIGGIDSAMGYLVANGDIPLFRFHGTQWVGWASIVAAVPTAICLVHAKAKPVTIIDRLKSKGWTDSGNFDHTQVGHLVAPSGGLYYNKGFRDWALTHEEMNELDFPIMLEASDGTVSAQTSILTDWKWSQAHGITRTPRSETGTVLAFYANQTHPTATPRQLDAEKVIGALAGVLKEF